MNTALVREKFQETVTSAAKTKVGNAADLLKSAKAMGKTWVSVKNVIRTDLLEEGKESLKAGVDALFIAKMTEHYGLVDESLFAFKRYLYIEDGMIVADRTHKGSEVPDATRMTVPLFPWAALSDGMVQMGTIKTRKEKWDKWKVVEVSAKLPVIPPDIARSGREAMAVYCRTMADLHLIEGSEILDDLTKEARLGVTWIPSESDMVIDVWEEVPKPAGRPDPALLLLVGKLTFLVDTWDIEEEEPFEHILREFTSGAFPAKK